MVFTDIRLEDGKVPPGEPSRIAGCRAGRGRVQYVVRLISYRIIDIMQLLLPSHTTARYFLLGD